MLWASLALAGEDRFGECEEVGSWFEDVADEVGVRALGNSLGLNLNDFDGDRDLDMLVATSPARAEHNLTINGETLLYLEDAEAFTEQGAAFGVDDLCEDRAPLFGDLDNDGLPDLYYTVNGRNLLLRNDGYGHYQDVTALAGDAGHPGWGHEGVLLDYDRDGLLDVFFTNGPEDGSGTNVLLRNLGDGVFVDVSEAAGVAGVPSGKGACVLDADGDEWPDLFVTTGREYGNQLYINGQSGRFTDEAVARGVSDPAERFGVGVVCEDLDSDGDPEIVVVTHDKLWTGNVLFRNDDGRFVDVALEAGFEEWLDGHGLAAVDVDLDMDLDLVLSGIGQPPILLRNDGELRFTRLCRGAGLVQEDGVTWAVAAGDLLGRDGYPEVVISNGLGRRPAPNPLFRNLLSGNHFLTVLVEAVSHNPSALGARVQVTVGEHTQTRWVGSWSSFDSQGPLPLTFGLGSNTVVDRVAVNFTNGVEQVLTQIEADQVLEVVEMAQRADDDADGVPDEWDLCPFTRVGHMTDAEGCAVGQRQGVSLGAVSPAQDEIVVDPPAFVWDGEATSVVLRVAVDGTFGVTRREYGPFTGSPIQLSQDDLAELRALSDGTAPLVWRLAGVGEDGGEALTNPRRMYVAKPVDLVEVPVGANLFEPAHIVVDAGTTVTWWNDPVSGGNLQNEIHDVQLMDQHGAVISPMADLNGGGAFTWTFAEAGFWSFLCYRHSGTGQAGEHIHETASHHHASGPYRCMAGTVTVR